jgi:hypothetical protein
MRIEILNIFLLLRIDITRDIEIPLVLLDFTDWDETGVFIDLPLVIKDVDDLMDILFPEPVLVAILFIALRRINHKDAFPGKYKIPEVPGHP